MKKLTKKTKKSLKIRKKSAKYKMSGGFNIENVKFILFDGDKILDDKITIINYFNNFYEYSSGNDYNIAKIIVCYINEINRYFKYIVVNDHLDIDYLYFNYGNKNYTVIVDYDNKFQKDDQNEIARLKEETLREFEKTYLDLHSHDDDDAINYDFVNSFNTDLNKKCKYPNELSISCGYLHTINKHNFGDVSENKSIKEITSYYPYITIYGFKGLIICLNKNNKCISSIIAQSDHNELNNKIVQISSRTHRAAENRKYNTLLCAFTILYFIDSNSKKGEYRPVDYIKSIAVNPISLYRMINYFDAKIPQTLYDIIKVYSEQKNIKFEAKFEAPIIIPKIPNHNNNISNNNNIGNNNNIYDTYTTKIVKFYSMLVDNDITSKNMSNISDDGIKNFIGDLFKNKIVYNAISYVYLHDANAKTKAETVTQNLFSTSRKSLRCD
uniref:Uncharacterized protein n=1 Tax=viral metagenome TaxID=1070528 RepID=A0A6C0E8Q2_9ZZZZ